MYALIKKNSVFTDSYYFYVGVKSLLEKFEVVWSNNCGDSRGVTTGVEVDELIIVDGAMFYGGDWSTFNASVNTNSYVLWFTQNDKWNLFPPHIMNNFRINTRESTFIIRSRVLDLINCRKRHSWCLQHPSLTRNEISILRYIVEGNSVWNISKLTGKSSKIIYRLRSKILDKFGFKTAYLFAVIYLSNVKLFGMYNLTIYYRNL